MNKIQKIIVVLLIIAFVFSIMSLAVNFSFGIAPVRTDITKGDSDAGIKLIIEENSENGVKDEP